MYILYMHIFTYTYIYHTYTYIQNYPKILNGFSFQYFIPSLTKKELESLMELGRRNSDESHISFPAMQTEDSEIYIAEKHTVMAP